MQLEPNTGFVELSQCALRGELFAIELRDSVDCRDPMVPDVLHIHTLTQSYLDERALIVIFPIELVGVEVPLVGRHSLRANQDNSLVLFHKLMEQDGWDVLRVVDENDVLLGESVSEEEPSDRLIGKVDLDGF